MQDGLGSVQSVLVLGGSSDIARASLRRRGEERPRVVFLAGRSPGRLDDAAEELRARGATVTCVAFDAAEPDARQTFVEDVFDHFGDIDLVLLAFGVLGDQSTAERDPLSAAHIAGVNYLGAVSVLGPIAERLRAQGHGVIVALSSVAGERVRATNFIYGSSKAGLAAYLQGLADRLDGRGAPATIVRPAVSCTKTHRGRTTTPPRA